MINKTLHQICRMIASGEIPKEIYNKYLGDTPIGFMTPLEIIAYLNSSPWIPVSERLPKHEELALVSALSYGENKAFVDILKMSNGKWYVFEPFCGWEEVTCDIIAWMPLPEPYKESDN